MNIYTYGALIFYFGYKILNNFFLWVNNFSNSYKIFIKFIFDKSTVFLGATKSTNINTTSADTQMKLTVNSGVMWHNYKAWNLIVGNNILLELSMSRFGNNFFQNIVCSQRFAKIYDIIFILNLQCVFCGVFYIHEHYGNKLCWFTYIYKYIILQLF